MSTVPTIYEYLGGQETLQRLAEAQYRRCLTDPVLTEVFGTEGRPGHVEHLAAWLGEVFGGPSAYTEQLGGHGALLRHHGNLGITEPQRQRFVEVFLEAADEVGLPRTPEFRRRFTEYLEWGSAIARSVSQPGADLSTDQPVPRWDWGPAGPPPAAEG
jgi:hemoglobin